MWQGVPCPPALPAEPVAPCAKPTIPPKDLSVFISEAFAQAAPAAANSTQSSLLSLLPLVLMFVVLYFIMIRPQMKRQKEHKAMIEALAKGDEVVLGGGVLGRVSKLGDSIVHVEVAGGVELQVQRPSIVQVLPKGTFK
jgi:preprotein translocase subunit YajC